MATFGYDTADRRTALTLPNGVTTSYAYDAGSRLTGLTYALGTTTLGTLLYGYDASGNRQVVGGTWARTGLPPALEAATYNAANRQLTFGAQTLAYDLNGNLTSDNTSTYTWDVRNRLSVITGPGPASFVYDGTGRRLAKTIDGTTTNFLYDGLNPVQEQAGSTLRNLLTGLGVDEFLTRDDGAGARGVLGDALGSTLALVDEAGAIQATYTYDPFGATTVTGSSGANSLSYTGREDDGTGLKYYRARYYSPSFQRFISEDPLEFDGDDANLYAYVSNNPTNYVDLLGTTIASGSSLFQVCGPPPLGARKTEKLLRAIQCSLTITPTPAGIAGGASSLGRVVTNPGIALKGLSGSVVPYHAIDQIITRGVTAPTILATLRNPVVVIQQGGRYLYLSNNAAVVINAEGQVVTAWTSAQFTPVIRAILGSAVP